MFIKLRIIVLVLAVVSLVCSCSKTEPTIKPKESTAIADDGSIRVPAFTMPFSNNASPEAKQAYIKQQRLLASIADYVKTEKVSRQQAFDKFFFPPLIASHQARYAVNIEPATIAGVYTEVFTPSEGVSEQNSRRVLINLHGGSFDIGARTGGQVESIPVAGVGKIKVISVDYRQGPEHYYPAANEDVVAVYRALLEHYPAENIGIYGCSVGGHLAGQTIPALQEVALPLPGAVGIIGASYGGDGDSISFAMALAGRAMVDYRPKQKTQGYFKDADINSPLINPRVSPELLAQFPPSLIINGLRDATWGGSIQLHNQLVKAGVDADLHLWPGGNHCFLYNSELPESREAYDVIVNFFDKHLGR